MTKKYQKKAMISTENVGQAKKVDFYVRYIVNI